jgi:hypothetical protein
VLINKIYASYSKQNLYVKPYASSYNQYFHIIKNQNKVSSNMKPRKLITIINNIIMYGINTNCKPIIQKSNLPFILHALETCKGMHYIIVSSKLEHNISILNFKSGFSNPTLDLAQKNINDFEFRVKRL